MAALAAKDPRLTAVRLSRNFGSNAAIMPGSFQARGDVVCVITADLQDPPELIPEMVPQVEGRRGGRAGGARRSATIRS
jgi:glycosyltransferase involved in cell wall biosynthesis